MMPASTRTRTTTEESIGLRLFASAAALTNRPMHRPMTMPWTRGGCRVRKAASRAQIMAQAPLSAIFCCASAIAPLRACTWWPSASPTTFLMARVTAGSTLPAAECG